jgi:hypothetical protein
MFAWSLQGFLSRPSHSFAGPESSPVPVHSSHSQSLPRSPDAIDRNAPFVLLNDRASLLCGNHLKHSRRSALLASKPRRCNAYEKEGWAPTFLHRYTDAFLLRRVAHTRTARNSSPVMRLLHTSLYTGESGLLPQKPARNSRPASVAWPLLPTRQSVDPNPACALFLQLSTFGFRPLQVQSPHLTQGDR